MLPDAGQPLGCIYPEEVTPGRLAQSVEMFVRPEERRLCIELNASLFANLADRSLNQLFVLLDANSGTCVPASGWSR